MSTDVEAVVIEFNFVLTTLIAMQLLSKVGVFIPYALLYATQVLVSTSTFTLR